MSTQLEQPNTATKRRLYKEYRQTVEWYNECNKHYNTGGDYLHGERIYQQCVKATRYLYDAEQYFISRCINVGDIPNVPAKVNRITHNERVAFIKQRQLERSLAEEQRLQEQISKQQEPLIAAMQKLSEFYYNYDHNFVSKAFDGRIAEHLQSKFDGYYTQHGSRGVMPAFIAELDAENKKALFLYILGK